MEPGYGLTVGNALRRVLLASLEGFAITSVRIDKVEHEFSVIEGVVEDVTEIILNVKGMIVSKSSQEDKVITVSANKAGEVTAAQIVADPSIEIMNPNHVLATLTEDIDFSMEMKIASGRGYSPAAERLAEEDRFEREQGNIEIDAIYSPVYRVRYKTEDTRVGQKTNYDRLVLEIWTDGTVTPEMALVEAGKILRKHINPFVEYFEMGHDTVEETQESQDEEESEIDEELAMKLRTPVQELELSVRASNCLEASHIETVGELVKMNEADLLKLRSFGKTSLREIARKITDMGLSLGMTEIDF